MTISVKKDVSTGTCHGKLLVEDGDIDDDDETYIYDVITECLTRIRRSKRPFLAAVKAIQGDISGDKNWELPMRKSLFAHVPPYIAFHAYDENGESSLPIEIKRHLLWWHANKDSHRMIRWIVLKSGFKTTVKSSDDWCGTWCSRFAHERLTMKKKSFQKTNHFPSGDEFSNKILLWWNYNRMRCKYGKQNFDYMPITYVLPEELQRLKRSISKKKGEVRRDAWILKPPNSCAGQGIRLIDDWHKLGKCTTPLVTQRYIRNPKLINGMKFDLRLYALLTSLDPLKVYLYTEGLVRFATVAYRYDASTFHDRYMHLTNTSVNKSSPYFVLNDDPNTCKGSMWSLKGLWRYLEEQERADVAKIWQEIKDIVVKTVLSAEASLIKAMRSTSVTAYNAYQLLGFDVLLDEYHRPWLLEVNDCPSMDPDTPLCSIIKGRLVRHYLNLVGFHVPDLLSSAELNALKIRRRCTDLTRLCLDPRLFVTDLLSAKDKEKRDRFAGLGLSRYRYLQSILNFLTPNDVRTLIRHEDELQRTGDFERVFPTRNTYRYFVYFDEVKYYDMLLDAWEYAYGHERKPGIRRLERLCLRRYHLR